MTDYSRLNDRIVKQAFDASGYILTEAQKQKLFQNKIDRAQEMLKGRDRITQLNVYHQIED